MEQNSSSSEPGQAMAAEPLLRPVDKVLAGRCRSKTNMAIPPTLTSSTQNWIQGLRP